MLFTELPTLGLGASLSLSEQPDPIALAQSEYGPQFIEYSGLVDVSRVIDEVQQLQQADIPILFHPSYINFCGSLKNDPAWLKATDEHIKTVNSPWFAQDCAYCFGAGGQGYSSQFGYFIPPILNAASLQQAVQRVQEVQAHCSVPVAIEPPPVSFSVGSMPVFEFFGELAERADCALLLDMGHLVSYEMATQQSLQQQLDLLPIERVIEVHIAGGKIKQIDDEQLYIDAHESDITTATWDMLEYMLSVLPNIKALCYECEGVDATTVIQRLQQIRQTIQEHSICSALKEAL